MNHLIASCLICLLLSIAFPGGGCGSQLFVVASIPIQQKSRPGQIPMASLLRTPNSHSTNRKREINNNEDENITFLTNTTDANTTNTTASPTPSTTPASAPTTPVPTPTHSPTKHYEPSPDDDNDEEPQKGPSVGLIFLYIFLAVSAIWIVCYFRDAILFFFGSAWNNTRRYGCKGCLQSFLPCFFGREYLSGSGSEPLDQIIFETEDPAAPLMT